MISMLLLYLEHYCTLLCIVLYIQRSEVVGDPVDCQIARVWCRKNHEVWRILQWGSADLSQAYYQCLSRQHLLDHQDLHQYWTHVITFIVLLLFNIFNFFTVCITFSVAFLAIVDVITRFSLTTGQVLWTAGLVEQYIVFSMMQVFTFPRPCLRTD